MRMRWLNLTMLHWRYPLEEVQALVPPEFTVESFDGSAWVGVVPFEMEIDIPFAPEMKSILHFPETNVRTYVHGPSGEPGVWFWSLEASSLSAVVTARSAYQVPYFWSDMSVDRVDSSGSTATADTSGPGHRLRYETRRRWPKPTGVTSNVVVEVGDAILEEETTELDNFLTSRWALYGAAWNFRSYAPMFHEPWPLYEAKVLHCDDQLVAATGLSQPEDDPIVHYSPAVNVRCGWPGRA